ncbi:MAG: hypothetical protein H6708_30340 [Kofleriaceae bacterium]|nr:hypothetical protein [Kofleriaceae bacterium]
MSNAPTILTFWHSPPKQASAWRRLTSRVAPPTSIRHHGKSSDAPIPTIAST